MRRCRLRWRRSEPSLPRAAAALAVVPPRTRLAFVLSGPQPHGRAAAASPHAPAFRSSPRQRCRPLQQQRQQAGSTPVVAQRLAAASRPAAARVSVWVGLAANQSRCLADAPKVWLLQLCRMGALAVICTSKVSTSHPDFLPHPNCACSGHPAAPGVAPAPGRWQRRQGGGPAPVGPRQQHGPAPPHGSPQPSPAAAGGQRGEPQPAVGTKRRHAPQRPARLPWQLNQLAGGRLRQRCGEPRPGLQPRWAGGARVGGGSSSRARR